MLWGTKRWQSSLSCGPTVCISIHICLQISCMYSGSGFSINQWHHDAAYHAHFEAG
jgi:hypothetical protein